MTCPGCGQDNPPQARFCMRCGQRFPLVCAQCGTDLPASAAFCFSCGHPTGAERAREPRFAAPEAYTPKHLAAKILTSRSALEGERKYVTVLFADLKGSMEALADRDPEDARTLLDPVLERMMEAVHRYEGTVNQVMGDGIMALFGAPLAHEDHALRACYAAVRMQESLRRHADDARWTRDVPLRIRVGLHSGEVVVRSITSDLRMDYTAVGETTHLAARMEQHAEPGTTLLTGHTLALVQGRVQVEPLGHMTVKGLTRTVEAYRLLGVGPVRSRLQVAAARGLTRFVGREAELAELHHSVERVATGHGQVVTLVGEPGVGKSRLVAEFTHAHCPRAWRVIETATASYGRAMPYLPVAGLLRDYFQVSEQEDAQLVVDTVTSRLRALDASLLSAIPALLTLLDVPVPEAAWQALDPVQRRRRIVDAVRGLWLREAQEQPLCLVVEDLHWIDAETQTLLDRLIDSLAAARILCLVSYRPEYEHAWSNKSYYTQVRVEPLAHESADALLRALLGDSPGLTALKKELVERTEGNPFFLEESVWHLVERGTLVGERGAYVLARAVPTIQVPATVHAVLAARIDRLPPEDKRLLQAAAIIGKDVPLPLLTAISDLDEDRVRTGLNRLEAAEFLYERSLFPHHEYTFKHVLTLEVAARTLLHEQRRALEASIVSALERLYPGRETEHVDRLATHALRGELWDKALVYCRRAGSKTFARSAHRTAVEWFEQALEALQHLPESPETTAQAIDVRLDLRYALSPLGEFVKMRDHLQQAEALAQASNDRRRLALVSAFLTNLYTMVLDLRQAVEYGERAVAIGSELGDPEVEVIATVLLGLAYHGLGEYRRAAELTTRAAERLGADRERERFGMALLPAVYARGVLAMSLAELGDFDRAGAAAAEGAAIAESAEHPYSIAFAGLSDGHVLLRKGDATAAIPTLERSLAIARNAELASVATSIAGALGSAYVLGGRGDDAVRLLEDAVERAAAIRDPLGHWLRTSVMAEAWLAVGRVAEALPLAQQGLDLTRYARARGQHGWAQYLVGCAAEAQSPSRPEEAEAAYRRALDRARELGMRPLDARCRLAMGSLYRAMGRRDEARTELEAASDALRALGMDAWLERARAELARAR